jgi:hypothetical protein
MTLMQPSRGGDGGGHIEVCSRLDTRGVKAALEHKYDASIIFALLADNLQFNHWRVPFTLPIIACQLGSCRPRCAIIRHERLRAPHKLYTLPGQFARLPPRSAIIIRMAFVPASLRKLKSIVRMENTGAEDIKATLTAADVPLSEADCRRCPDPCEEGVWLFLETTILPFPSPCIRRCAKCSNDIL